MSIFCYTSCDEGLLIKKITAQTDYNIPKCPVTTLPLETLTGNSSCMYRRDLEQSSCLKNPVFQQLFEHLGDCHFLAFLFCSHSRQLPGNSAAATSCRKCSIKICSDGKVVCGRVAVESQKDVTQKHLLRFYYC